MFAADGAMSIEIEMHVRNGVDKIKRVMVISGRYRKGSKSTCTVNAEVTRNTYKEIIFAFKSTSITLKQSRPLHQC